MYRKLHNQTSIEVPFPQGFFSHPPGCSCSQCTKGLARISTGGDHGVTFDTLALRRKRDTNRDGVKLHGANTMGRGVVANFMMNHGAHEEMMAQKPTENVGSVIIVPSKNNYESNLEGGKSILNDKKESLRCPVQTYPTQHNSRRIVTSKRPMYRIAETTRKQLQTDDPNDSKSHLPGGFCDGCLKGSVNLDAQRASRGQGGYYEASGRHSEPSQEF